MFIVGPGTGQVTVKPMVLVEDIDLLHTTLVTIVPRPRESSTPPSP
jgi:hypothetical protein